MLLLWSQLNAMESHLDFIPIASSSLLLSSCACVWLGLFLLQYMLSYPLSLLPSLGSVRSILLCIFRYKEWRLKNLLALHSSGSFSVSLKAHDYFIFVSTSSSWSSSASSSLSVVSYFPFNSFHSMSLFCISLFLSLALTDLFPLKASFQVFHSPALLFSTLIRF